MKGMRGNVGREGHKLGMITSGPTECQFDCQKE